MELETPTMTPAEARWHLLRLGLSQQALARVIRVNPSTVRRWLKRDGTALDIPRAVQLLLRILTPTQARRLIAADEQSPA
jgi:DNA-binding transcriptional regulator YiaG